MSSWDDVTVIRKSARPGQATSSSAIKQAFKNGHEITSERKDKINSNVGGVEGSKAAKIDREQDGYKKTKN
jgi:hypothetical protein